MFVLPVACRLHWQESWLHRADLYRKSTFGSWQETIHTTVKDVRAVAISDPRSFDAIAHLAALSNDPLGDLNPSLTAPNLIFTHHRDDRHQDRRLMSELTWNLAVGGPTTACTHPRYQPSPFRC